MHYLLKSLVIKILLFRSYFGKWFLTVKIIIYAIWPIIKGHNYFKPSKLSKDSIGNNYYKKGKHL